MQHEWQGSSGSMLPPFRVQTWGGRAAQVAGASICPREAINLEFYFGLARPVRAEAIARRRGRSVADARDRA